MTDERDLEVVLNGRVDETEPVLGAGRQRDHGILAQRGVGRVDVGAVEEDIIAAGWDGLGLSLSHAFVGSDVVVISDGINAKVNIIVRRRWTVDVDGPDDSIAILR